MNSHKHARLTAHGRALLVRRMLEEGLRAEEAAKAMGVSVRTAYKWRRRYIEEGEAGLRDRGSRPAHCPHQTAPSQCERIITLRRKRRTYREIHECTGVSMATIGRVLQRAGLNRLSVLDPPRPIRRYTCDRPGQLLHLDVKKLGRFHRPGHRVTDSRRMTSRGAGWDYVHVAVDDASRLALSTVHADETGRSACRALIQAIRYYRGFGITIERVMTDNGACYKSQCFARLLRRLGIRHIRTKPYTPRTNGKAERFIQTALREWAYARSYDNADQRTEHLPAWLHQYNWHRPHASLNYQPPVSALGLSVNNLVGLHN